jgi:hypothetical protein
MKVVLESIYYYFIDYNVKFPLCLLKYHIMKAYGRMETLFHVFLNSTPDVSDRLSTQVLYPLGTL